MTNKTAIRLSPDELEIMKFFSFKPFEFISSTEFFRNGFICPEEIISVLEKKGALFDKMQMSEVCFAFGKKHRHIDHYRFKGWCHD